ncbi:MAG: trypsin-like serine protease, partial [Actinomycetia bacterium]|nr:trypsin-like serine protease [Actinomycetes bacterium]
MNRGPQFDPFAPQNDRPESDFLGRRRPSVIPSPNAPDDGPAPGRSSLLGAAPVDAPEPRTQGPRAQGPLGSEPPPTQTTNLPPSRSLPISQPPPIRNRSGIDLPDSGDSEYDFGPRTRSGPSGMPTGATEAVPVEIDDDMSAFGPGQSDNSSINRFDDSNDGDGYGYGFTNDDGDYSDGRLEARSSGSATGPNWRTISAVSAVLVLIVGGIVFLSRFRSDDSLTDTLNSQEGLIVNPTVNQMAQSTVQIVGLDRNGQALCSGSGTFVSTDGMILTNAHVVTRDSVCDFVSLGISVTADANRPPEMLYLAEPLVYNNDVDLAVIRVTQAVGDNIVLPDLFPALVVGDSDALSIGDDVRVLGYPEIGGETITFTNGSVSGFTAQAGIGERALIKTDATIAGGNSGGAAVDSEGRLIGIPTKARASESGPAVDCRPLADTNADGQVDDNDNCVPIGGFLNGIRPINLALELIQEASASTPQAFELAAPEVEVDLDGVRMSRPRFSLGEAENAPAQTVVTATAGVAELCLFVDWSGIPNGAKWDGIWFHNAELVDDFSLVKQTWEFGPQGNNFWMCAIDDQDGLESGLYELGFFLSGELVFAEGIVLTEDQNEVFSTQWENTTDVSICALAINPKGSGPVGLNELAPGTMILPGETVTIDLPTG